MELDRTWWLKVLSSCSVSLSLEGFMNSQREVSLPIGIRKEDPLEKVAVSLSLKAECTLKAVIPQKNWWERCENPEAWQVPKVYFEW